MKFKSIKLFIDRVHRLFSALDVWHAMLFLAQWFNNGVDVVKFKPKICKHYLYVRKNTNDLQIFWQIFSRKDCDILVDESPLFIVDAGANVGYTSVFFSEKYKNAQIIAIEPELNNCNMFLKNSSRYKNIRLLPCALWNKSCDVYIKNPEAGSDSFFVEEINGRKHSHDKQQHIRAVTIREIMNTCKVYAIDILKIDIEGGEYDVFADGDEWLKYVKNIFIELHHKEGKEKTDIIKKLTSNGFKFSLSGEYHVFSRVRIVR